MSTTTKSASQSPPISLKLPLEQLLWRLQQELLATATTLGYHLYSIWLFTYSDIKTIIVPKTTFGTLCALAAPVFGFSASYTPTPVEVLQRIPLTLLWVWINLLPFAIDNQRHASSSPKIA